MWPKAPPVSERGRAGGSEDAQCHLAYRQMIFSAAGGQSDIHGMRPELAHHLRSDISARDAFLGQIFELRTNLTQRRFRNNRAGFFGCGSEFARLRWKRLRFRVTWVHSTGDGRLFRRLSPQIASPLT